MRQFSAEYLETTRRGMWDGARSALADLDLPSRRRVVDAGCGTGELTRVLAAETPGEVIGVDRDRELLESAAEQAPVVRGDACTLPFRDDAADLVVCQALLINLPEPVRAVREFGRVSSELVAVIEPDNAAVVVESTVDSERALARRARERFLDGVETGVTLGADAQELFETAGVEIVSTTRYDHERTVEPPYSETALEAARRKASGAGLASDRETMLAGDTTRAEYEHLREEWRAMGRTVVEQMRDREYERSETVPWFVTVGRVR